jgi:hypothetical protein
METQTLKFYAILVSNQGLEEDIQAVQEQMKTMKEGSPEYEYDQLQVEREQRELQIREANPNLDPQTRAGNQALAQLLAKDPLYQSIVNYMQELVRANPNESTSWGLPCCYGNVKYAEID